MSRLLTHPIDDQLTAKADQRIEMIIRDPNGLPNGKHKRSKLSLANAQKFRSALKDAVEHAAVFAINGPLPNRVQRRGRPPDNAYFIFIDDIVRACKAAGLKPGLRYVSASESLPVRVFIELAPLLWGPVKAPRRLFQRWQRLQRTLVRGPTAV